MSETRIEGGSRVIYHGPIRIACMAPEARECLDVAIEQWNAHLAQRSRPPEDPVYSFAYWLLRYSGLVVPAVPATPESEVP